MSYPAERLVDELLKKEYKKVGKDLLGLEDLAELIKPQSEHIYRIDEA